MREHFRSRSVGTGQAGDEAAPNGSAHVCHEDEDCAGRELRGTGNRRARYDVEPPELTNHDLEDFSAVYKH